MVHEAGESRLVSEESEEPEEQGSNSTSSYTRGLMLSNLPDEIIFKILLKLHIEALFVCSAVSKFWYRTIKSPLFIKTYNTNAIQNSDSPLVLSRDAFFLPQEESARFQLIHSHEETSLTFYQKSSQPPPISQILFCHGWVLSVLKPKERYGSESQPYFVCNPITGEQMIVPKSPVDAYPTRRGSQGIVGFGWDSASNAFKVIRISDICGFKRYYGTYLEIFNFALAEWRVIKWSATCQDPCRASSIFRFKFRTNTSLNGRLHWLSYPYDQPMSIVSFNLENEEFQIVPMPPALDLESRPENHGGHGYDGRMFEHYLLVLGDCLSIVNIVNDKHVEIWVMKVYGSQLSWEKRYIVKNIVMDNIHPIKGPYKPIKLMRNGDILLLCSDQNLGYYHPITKVFKQVEVGDVLYRPSISKPMLHVGSLIYIAKK